MYDTDRRQNDPAFFDRAPKEDSLEAFHEFIKTDYYQGELRNSRDQYFDMQTEDYLRYLYYEYHPEEQMAKRIHFICTEPASLQILARAIDFHVS